MLGEDDFREGLRNLTRDARNSDERAFMIATLIFLHLRDQADDYQAEMLRTFREFRLLLESVKDLPRTLHYKVNLLVYCHIIEADSVYVYLWNLLRIAAGHCHEQHPFRRASINSKVDRLKVAAHGSSYGVEHMLDEAIDTDLRNAFSHNQYLLDRTGMTFSRSDRWVSYQELEGTLSKAQVFYEELANGAQQAVAFLQSEGEDIFRGRDGSELVVTRTLGDNKMWVQLDGL